MQVFRENLIKHNYNLGCASKICTYIEELLESFDWRVTLLFNEPYKTLRDKNSCGTVVHIMHHTIWEDKRRKENVQKQVVANQEQPLKGPLVQSVDVRTKNVKNVFLYNKCVTKAVVLSVTNSYPVRRKMGSRYIYADFCTSCLVGNHRQCTYGYVNERVELCRLQLQVFEGYCEGSLLGLMFSEK